MTHRRAETDPEDWFLTVEERGNPASDIDRRHADGRAWTAGNHVMVHIDGAGYFRSLHRALSAVSAGGHLWFADWKGSSDQLLDGPGSEVGTVLGELAERGVDVRGLLWRSHPRQANFNEQDNMGLARTANQHGAQLVLDQRVRLGGSHHQKLVVVGGGEGPGAVPDVAYAGGIDLSHGRGDDADHGGDPQPTDELDATYGDRPPWHDAQVEVRGPAAADLAFTFRERWNDPTHLDHRNPWRALQRRLLHQPRSLEPLPEPTDPGAAGAAGGDGPHLVQVVRTYPARRTPYPFAPDGERSVARAHLKALRRARRLIVVEDQYLWSAQGADAIAAALRAQADLRVVIVVPRHPDQDGRLTGPAHRGAQHRVIRHLRAAGGDRVAVYDLVNRAGTPIYVHAKVCVIDDVWLEIGSDNLNRRSWTHDSEVGCAVLDERLDPRSPTDPGGLGDGARVLARDTRLQLWCEHLGREPGDDADLVDPEQGWAVLAEHARELTAWEDAGGRGPRPPGHLAVHRSDAIPAWRRPVATLAYRHLLDPDGRSRADRRADRY